MVTPIMTQTLPTVIGMGVVSRTTETMFGKRQAAAGRRGVAKAKQGMTKRPRATVVVGVSRTRSGADDYAKGYRKQLKRRGVPYIGRVQVKRVSGGYAAVFMRG